MMLSTLTEEGVEAEETRSVVLYTVTGCQAECLRRVLEGIEEGSSEDWKWDELKV